MKQDHAAIVLEAERLRDEFIARAVRKAFASLTRLFMRKPAVGKAV